MSQIVQSLNPLTIPICGEYLIEASAGTGKTFTIGLFYLRLLLGLGGKNSYSRPLLIEEILVVTFTEAATAELRERIREAIHELRLTCIRGFSDNSMLESLLKDIEHPTHAALMLLHAERQIDKAAIFTIHGFCQRILRLNVLESGMLFEQQLIEDELLLFQQATADFWRRYFYPLNLNIAQLIVDEWSGPEQLLSTLLPLLHRKEEISSFMIDEEETLTLRHEKNLSYINAMKSYWIVSCDEVLSLIKQSNIDKRSYNCKNLMLWVNKISQWAKTKTNNYNIPSELARFGYKELKRHIKKGPFPLHKIFIKVDEFLTKKISLREFIVTHALKEIHQLVQKEKWLRSLLSFNDLIIKLDETLKQPNGEQLAKVIRQRFPVALIDEFQDTDKVQYSIFHRLYINQPNHALFMIGDPKQAIYSFRGADIFTYIQARNKVKKYYTLNTNWRSSAAMVHCINSIFSRLDRPFIFKEIPFIPVNCALQNQMLTLTVNNQVRSAVRFWLQSGEGNSLNDYQQCMAQQCASDISNWLQAGQQNLALFSKEQMLRPVQASDITILVRNRNEANLMRKALSQFDIRSVYLSNQESVYNTLEAKELLWLLQGVLAPEQEFMLRAAMATSLFNCNSAQLDLFSQDLNCWDELVDIFYSWQLVWKQRGILPMIREVIFERKLAENMLLLENSERRLTDLLHLGELLQEASTKLDTPHSLVRYLAQQIAHTDSKLTNQQLRLESDNHLVQIVTIHKSKGLQYPIVWLPFASGFRKVRAGSYRNSKNHSNILVIQASKNSIELSEKERLSEDLRLLYVALTRSIYHCSVGVAPVFYGNRKKIGPSDFHSSALGYLIQKGTAATAQQLSVFLKEMTLNGFDVKLAKQVKPKRWKMKLNNESMLNVRKITRSLVDFWRVISFTSIQKHNNHFLLDSKSNFDINFTEVKVHTEQQAELLTPHDFPCGTGPGLFLHKLFESLDFTQPVSTDKILQYLQKNNYPLYWQLMLSKWITCVVNTPLNIQGMNLSKVLNKNRLVEIGFCLPIDNIVNHQEINTIIQENDALSASAPLLDFLQVQGMLKGVIDLIFKWEDKYYLLDYKSNKLGDNYTSYAPYAMAQEMIVHRYDLQYQLYTLALHRYLKHRLTNYEYEKYFGGVFYLFLRGMNGISPNHGVFFTRPKHELILKLDSLFRGQESAL